MEVREQSGQSGASTWYTRILWPLPGPREPAAVGSAKALPEPSRPEVEAVEVSAENRGTILRPISCCNLEKEDGRLCRASAPTAPPPPPCPPLYSGSAGAGMWIGSVAGAVEVWLRRYSPMSRNTAWLPLSLIPDLQVGGGRTCMRSTRPIYICMALLSIHASRQHAFVTRLSRPSRSIPFHTKASRGAALISIPLASRQPGKCHMNSPPSPSLGVFPPPSSTH